MAKFTLPLKSLRNLTLGVLLLTLGGVVGFRYGQSAGSGANVPLSQIVKTAAPAELNSVDFSVFWEVWQYLDHSYLDTDKLDARKMVDGAISGMTAAAGDPYTTYLPPKQNKLSGEDLAGSFYGVGIVLGYVDDTLAVMSPLDKMPAAEAGVQAGDLILHVKDETKNLDEDTTDWTLEEAMEKIRGKKDVPVVLTLLRKDQPIEGKTDELAYGKPFEVEIHRGEIVIKSVTLKFAEAAGKKVAHIKVSKFGERTPAEFDEAVNKILAKKSELSGVVLDLRNNPGGYFNDAIDMASEFIKSGVVVTQKDKYSSRDFSADGKARLADLPVEVLVNKGSASAAEIVAGALHDQLGAKLIGQNTFGKGTVQDVHSLSNGGGLHVTIARWLMPEGEWIHDTGIPADIEVKDDPETEADEVLVRAIEEI